MKMTRTRCKNCIVPAEKNLSDYFQCDLFPKAMVILREKLAIDQPPPVERRPAFYPSCYRLKTFVFVDFKKGAQ